MNYVLKKSKDLMSEKNLIIKAKELKLLLKLKVVKHRFFAKIYLLKNKQIKLKIMHNIFITYKIKI
jgi:hypothetical protein